MNSWQRKTLKAVFSEPVPANILWSSIENLLVGVGCEMIEGRGSRVRFADDLRALEDEGIQVAHILADGKLEWHGEAMERLLPRGRCNIHRPASVKRRWRC